MESEISDLEKELLKRLDTYGESLMDNDDYEERIKNAKRVKKRKKIVEEDDVSEQVHRVKRKKRKRNKHKVEKDCSLEATSVEDKQSKVSGKEKRIQQMKDELGLNGVEGKEMKSEVFEDAGEETQADSKVVVYKRPKSKRKESENMNLAESVQDADKSAGVIDLKSARLDVQKFGIKGFKDEKKDAAMESLLIKLGAKPKKNKAYNYKEYQELVKKQRVEERNKQELDRQLGYKIKKKEVVRKKDRNDVGRVDGQVGFYKHGVQFVTKKDLRPGGGPVKKKRKKKF
jgi:hypothetical protein